MFTASRFSKERTEPRTRSTKAFTAFSLTRLPGGTISRTTGVDVSASRNGRPMRACMGTRRYLNVLRPATWVRPFLRDETGSIMYGGRLSESRRRVGRANPAEASPVRPARYRLAGRFAERARSAQRPDGACAEHRRNRSEERRVGKECRSRWSPYH